MNPRHLSVPSACDVLPVLQRSGYVSQKSGLGGRDGQGGYGIVTTQGLLFLLWFFPIGNLVYPAPDQSPLRSQATALVIMSGGEADARNHTFAEILCGGGWERFKG